MLKIGLFILGGAAILLLLATGLPWLFWYCDSCSWGTVTAATGAALVVVQLTMLILLRREWRAVALGIGTATVITVLVTLLLYPVPEPWALSNLIYPMLPALLGGTAVSIGGFLVLRRFAGRLRI
jgi:uncharacterized membrane protein YkgB